MRTAPWIIGITLAVIGGAVSGASVTTTPIVNRGADAGGEVETVFSSAGDDLPSTRHLPDHYALETPSGRVEVADLALHGRLHDSAMAREWRGDGPQETYAAYDVYMDDRDYEFADAEVAPPAPVRRMAATPPTVDIRIPAQSPLDRQGPSRAEAPLALAEPAPVIRSAKAEAPAGGNARIINVAAALSAQK